MNTFIALAPAQHDPKEKSFKRYKSRKLVLRLDFSGINTLVYFACALVTEQECFMILCPRITLVLLVFIGLKFTHALMYALTSVYVASKFYKSYIRKDLFPE